MRVSFLFIMCGGKMMLRCCGKSNNIDVASPRMLLTSIIIHPELIVHKNIIITLLKCPTCCLITAFNIVLFFTHRRMLIGVDFSTYYQLFG